MPVLKYTNVRKIFLYVPCTTFHKKQAIKVIYILHWKEYIFCDVSSQARYQDYQVTSLLSSQIANVLVYLNRDIIFNRVYSWLTCLFTDAIDTRHPPQGCTAVPFIDQRS